MLAACLFGSGLCETAAPGGPSLVNFVHYDMQEFILDSLKLLNANVLCCELP